MDAFRALSALFLIGSAQDRDKLALGILHIVPFVALLARVAHNFLAVGDLHHCGDGAGVALDGVAGVAVGAGPIFHVVGFAERIQIHALLLPLIVVVPS